MFQSVTPKPNLENAKPKQPPKPTKLNPQELNHSKPTSGNTKPTTMTTKIGSHHHDQPTKNPTAEKNSLEQKLSQSNPRLKFRQTPAKKTFSQMNPNNRAIPSWRQQK